MIFKELVLEDVGLFGGRNRFQLTSEGSDQEAGDRPIVLFGGKNGTGKTTILNSVRLCLYGKRAAGARVSRADYRDYLRRLIHRSPKGESSPRSASVSLLFTHAHAGRETTYLVERQWRISSSDNVHEELLVYEDGEPLDRFEPEHWQDFVRDLVPYGVSQLFFFDGEKIQSLAEERGSREQLGEAIKMLLGLHLTERLTSDLDIYLGRIEGDSDGQAFGERIRVLRDELQELGEEKAQTRQKSAQLRAKADHVKAQIERKEDKLASEGASFAETRDDLKERRAQLDAEIESSRSTIRELASGLLPFALAPSLLEELSDQLDKEARKAQWSAAAAVLDERIDAFVRELDLVELFDGKLESSELTCLDVQARLRTRLESLVTPPQDVSDIEVRHHASENDCQRMKIWIEGAKTRVPERLKDVSIELEEKARERRRVEQLIKKAPSKDQLRPIMEEIAELHQELGALEQRIDSTEAQIKDLVSEEESREKELRRTRGKLEGMEEAAERSKLVTRVQQLLDDYRDRITDRKVKELRYQFAECFNRLSRKEDMIREIEIDPDDFSVVLKDADGQSVPKSQLSAGEKQLYAVAMLWALGLTSGRPLPVIVDTPLARLDSDHRENLVRNYFPNASHQVIILSTDTEIDTRFFQMLEDDLARAYHLSFNASAGRTEVEQGYFWTDKQRLANAV